MSEINFVLDTVLQTRRFLTQKQVRGIDPDQRASYCFKTQRAIEYFGNGDCYINDEDAVPLTPAERARYRPELL